MIKSFMVKIELGIAAALLLGVTAITPVYAGGGECSGGVCDYNWPQDIYPPATEVYQRPDYFIDRWHIDKNDNGANILRVRSRTHFLGLGFLWTTDDGTKEGISELSQKCEVIAQQGIELVFKPGINTAAVTVSDPDCLQGQPSKIYS